MVRLSQFLWRIGSVPSQFVAPGTCASVQFEVHLLSLSTIKQITRPRNRPVFFAFDDGRCLTRNGGGAEADSLLRIQFTPQPLRQLLDVFQFLDGVFGQRASAD